MTKAATCSRCGKKILNGLAYTHNGKAFCYECFKNMQADLLATEEEKTKLYQYIKKLFSLTELPSDTINSISKEIGKGRTYSEIQSTLYYYYEIMENKRSSIDYLPFIIKDQYENACNYKKEVAELKKVNEQVDLSHTKKRTIVLSQSDLKKQNPHKKKSYNISDL